MLTFSDLHAAETQAGRLFVEAVLNDYADAIDCGDFERWSDMFADDGSYRLVPRLNTERGFPISLMDCPNKAWINDRAKAILHASLYSPHYYRHLYTNITVKTVDGDQATVRCNYAVYRTDGDGDTDLLSVGGVQAVILLDNAAPIKQMTVTYDTYRINGVLVFPL